MSEHRIRCHYGEKIINSKNNSNNKTVCPPPALTDKVINLNYNANSEYNNNSNNNNSNNNNSNNNTQVNLCSGNKAYIVNKPNQSKKMRNSFLIQNGKGKRFVRNGN